MLGERIMTLRTKLIVSAIAAAAAFSVTAASAASTGTVTSSELQDIDKWFGRAGGIVGSDRVSALRAGDKSIGVSWDQDVAARTNMSRERANTATVGVSYDQEVAARTNMGRGAAGPVKAAGVEGTKAN
jgi:hypothetical protein